MKKELKSGILSADKSADDRPINRPTVFLVNVIAVLQVVEYIYSVQLDSKTIMQCQTTVKAKFAGFLTGNHVDRFSPRR